jgi:chemotaxis protein MotB
MTAKTQPIIVIKRNGGAHAGHNGGAWKVAYADFVTAMMSLFIVLWLMGASDKVKKAVAGYFNDPKGTANLLGTTMSGNGVAVIETNGDMRKLKEKLEEQIQARKDLDKLSKQIEITITAEGLRMELLEGKNGTFYQSGSAKLSESGQELLALLAAELKTLPNELLIEGHTDATQYSSDASYSNWELSADRANAARRLLQQDGVRADQVAQVRGYADQLLRVKSNPYDPSNRRISILVKNIDGKAPNLPGAEGASGPSPTAAPVPKDAGPAHAENVSPAPNGVAKPSAAASTQSKPAVPVPPARPGLMDRLKSMMPGKKS